MYSLDFSNQCRSHLDQEIGSNYNERWQVPRKRTNCIVLLFCVSKPLSPFLITPSIQSISFPAPTQLFLQETNQTNTIIKLIFLQLSAPQLLTLIKQTMLSHQINAWAERLFTFRKRTIHKQNWKLDRKSVV